MLKVIFFAALAQVLAPQAAIAAVEHWWKKRGFDTREAVYQWWEKTRAAQHNVAKLPPAAVVKLFQEGMRAQVIVPGLDAAVELDINCDGKQDYAVVALPRDGVLVRALLNKSKPSFDELKAIHAEYLRYAHSEGAGAYVAISRPDGTHRWFLIGGVSFLDAVPAQSVKGCDSLCTKCCGERGRLYKWDSSLNDIAMASESC